MITVYGIPNCDKVRKTRKWLREQAVTHEFHDFRREGVDAALLREWINQLGCEALLNRRGTTWRQLNDAERQQADSDEGAIQLMQSNPSLIRRPVVERRGRIVCGFDPQQLRNL